MKKIRILLCVALFASCIALEAMGPPPPQDWGDNDKGGCVATPLDGGLLAFIGVAGIGYYLFRKRNKKTE